MYDIIHFICTSSYFESKTQCVKIDDDDDDDNDDDDHDDDDDNECWRGPKLSIAFYPGCERLGSGV